MAVKLKVNFLFLFLKMEGEIELISAVKRNSNTEYGM